MRALSSAELVCPAPADAAETLLLLGWESGFGLCIRLSPDGSGHLTASAALIPAPQLLDPATLQGLTVRFSATATNPDPAALGL